MEPGNPRVMLEEYLRPWKLATFAAGMAWLLWGAFHEGAADWDVGISLLMGTLTYLTAPVSARILMDRRWRWLPLALFWYWLCVDGCYWAYWRLVDPEALVLREANFYASSCLFWLCGFIWLHNGPLRNLLATDGRVR